MQGPACAEYSTRQPCLGVWSDGLGGMSNLWMHNPLGGGLKHSILAVLERCLAVARQQSLRHEPLNTTKPKHQGSRRKTVLTPGE